MIKTDLTEKLGIEYPLVGGAMMRISTAEFVAAISDAGGLGVMASVIYKTKEEFEAAIDKAQSLTDKPFAVNINLFPAVSAIDNNIYVDVMAEKGVKIVETSGHAAPEKLSERFKEEGMTWIHKCVGVRYAKKARKLGADLITVVGYENGGATGKLDLGTMVLVPSAVDALDVPVIGGGGVSDGRGVLAVLALGAQAVIMGTRLMATKECPIHDDLKQALVNAAETDTMLIMRSIGATHRVWVNEAAQKCAELEETGGDLGQLMQYIAGENTEKMYTNGELDAGTTSCGQGIGLVHDIPTVKELLDRMMKEAAEIKNRL